jgi:hypothetical protein
MQIIPEGRVRFNFQVTRCLAGYMWVDDVSLESGDEHERAVKGRTDVLVARAGIDSEGPLPDPAWEVYRPLERESALFRIFADLDVKNQESILGFANRYGRLCSVGIEVGFEHKGSGHRTEAETIDYWRENVLAVRHWTKVSELVQERKSKELLDYIRWLPEWAEEEREGKRYTPIFNLITDSQPILDATPSRRLAAARDCLFFGLWESDVRENLTFHVEHDKEHETMRLRLNGVDLVTAIWAQLALAVVEDKEYRQCEFCGKPFELAPDIARTNRYFCSHSCRLKAYRARQHRAVRLHKQGKKLKTIAELLESDVRTVRGWIATAKVKEDESKRKK